MKASSTIGAFAADERRPPDWAEFSLLILSGLALVIGLAIRFTGLAERPLAVDEYYTVRAIEAVLAHGVPAFETGGYYVRGLPYQYAGALVAKLFEPGLFAYRLPASLFGAGVLALAFLYGRRWLPPVPAAALTAILAVSSWQVEFAHLIRMYTLFSLSTLAFCLALHEVVARGRFDRAWLLPLAGLAACLSHELGILLLPLMGLPLLMPVFWHATESVERIGYAVLSGMAIASGLILAQFDFRDLGVTDPLPAGLVVAAGPPPLAEPFFPFFSSVEPLAGGGLFVLLLALAFSLLLVLQRHGKAIDEAWFFAIAAFVAALFHNGVLFGLASTLLFVRAGSRPLQSGRALPAVMGLAVLVMGVWFVLALGLTPSDYPEASSRPSLIWKTLFGWPNLANPMNQEFLRTYPVLVALYGLGFAWFVGSSSKRAAGQLLANPNALVFILLTLMALLRPTWWTTRYLFFIYPLMVVAITTSLFEMGRAARLRFGPCVPCPEVLAPAVLLAGFLVSGDFDPQHLSRISSPEVVFRTGTFAEHEDVWYYRYDFVSPARFVEAQLGAPDASGILVENAPPVSWYLEHPHATYYGRGSHRFMGQSRTSGTINLWTNQRQLSTPEEVLDWAAGFDQVWWIRSSEFAPDTTLPDDIWQDHAFAEDDVFQGADGRVRVIRVRLSPGRIAADVPTDSASVNQASVVSRAFPPHPRP